MKTVVLLIGFIVASIHVAEAQQANKVPQIGFLIVDSPSAALTRVEAFQRGLKTSGM